MATFGWAYVGCDNNTGSGSAGPAHSIQFITESGGATTGSAYLTYYTGSAVAGRSGHTLYLTGTLVVTGAISASSYHIENITQIGATGSTNFGNSNDDVHIRTGSFVVANASGIPILTASAYSQQVFVKGFGGNYTRVAGTSYTASVSDYIIGVPSTSNTNILIPSASQFGSGSILIVKDEYVGRVAGKITLSASVGYTIDNELYYILTGSAPAISLYSNGSNWFVF